MSKNIEIKARIRDRNALEARVLRIADSGPEEIAQEDVFFNTKRGRLKLRIFNENDGELIYYERENQAGARLSIYSRVVTDRPRDMQEMLSSACGVQGIVRKQRRVYLAGNTRIHLDTVEGLGDFLELEVVLSTDQEPSAGQKLAEQLMNRLRIQQTDLVECAYLDLILLQTNVA
jgi:predicted adenylyl cyclase CyaB